MAFQRTWLFHPNGKDSLIAETAKAAHDMARQGWREEPFPEDENAPVVAQVADPNATAVAHITPDQEALYKLTFESVKQLVSENLKNRLVAKQILIDELDNPNHPGGRKSVVMHCWESLRAFGAKNAEPEPEPEPEPEAETGDDE